MKRKDFVKFGEREGVVLDAIEGGKVVWQDMTVNMVDGRPCNNHPMLLNQSELKSAKKREYTYDAVPVVVNRVTEKAIGCTIDNMDFYVPKSICNVKDSTAKNEGDTGELLIADWWLDKAKKEKEEQMMAPVRAAFDQGPVPVPDDGIPF